MNGSDQKTVCVREYYSHHGKHRGRQEIARLNDRNRNDQIKIREALKPRMYGSVTEAVAAENKRIGRR